VQAKQPHKPTEERNLAPLELIHSDLCEMNGEYTKGGKKYFMTFIDDSTRYYYVYLLKTKDEALDFFKIYKAEVENQLEMKNKEITPYEEWEKKSPTLSYLRTFGCLAKVTLSINKKRKLGPNPWIVSFLAMPLIALLIDFLWRNLEWMA
jgi:hypothetical protein